MKTMKKIGAILLAAAMIFALSAIAFAASNPLTPDSTSVWKTSFKDTVKAVDGDKAKNIPAVTVAYSIAAGSAVAASTTSPKINAGVGSPTIGNAVHAATASGTITDTVPVSLDFTGVSFTEAGIYRYVITQGDVTSTVSGDIEKDVQNTNTKGTYYLDVFVKKVAGTSGAADTFEPYAYAMFSDLSGTITLSSGTSGNTATYSSKTDEIVNTYETDDLTLTKTIVGDSAANSFDFTITINAPVGVIYTVDGTNYTGTGADQTITKSLGNGGKVEIKGLPSTATYKISEAVNQLEGYTVAVTDSNSSHTTYGWNTTGGSATAYEGADAVAIGEDDVTVAYTNTLETISPTGVAMRIAPFMAIGGAGIIFLALSKKSKKEEE